MQGKALSLGFFFMTGKFARILGNLWHSKAEMCHYCIGRCVYNFFFCSQKLNLDQNIAHKSLIELCFEEGKKGFSRRETKKGVLDFLFH